MFRVFASFVGMHDSCGNGWTDYELLVWSNSKSNAKKKIWVWAKDRGAHQKSIQFVDEDMWKRDHCYDRHYIR